MGEGQLSDIPSQKRSRREKEDVIRQHREDFRKLMLLPEFRRFLWWVLGDVCGVWADKFSGDSVLDARISGMRAVGVQLLMESQRVSKKEYLTMIQELIAERGMDTTQEDDDGSPRED